MRSERATRGTTRRERDIIVLERDSRLLAGAAHARAARVQVKPLRPPNCRCQLLLSYCIVDTAAGAGSGRGCASGRDDTPMQPLQLRVTDALRGVLLREAHAGGKGSDGWICLPHAVQSQHALRVDCLSEVESQLCSVSDHLTAKVGVDVLVVGPIETGKKGFLELVGCREGLACHQVVVDVH